LRANSVYARLIFVDKYTTVKNFVDLYFLLNDIAFERVAEWARYKIVPIDYEGLVITFSERQLEGEVLLTHPLTEHEFNGFVNRLIQTMFEYAKRGQ
jgi:hypothetical protein